MECGKRWVEHKLFVVSTRNDANMSGESRGPWIISDLHHIATVGCRRTRGVGRGAWGVGRGAGDPKSVFRKTLSSTTIWRAHVSEPLQAPPGLSDLHPHHDSGGLGGGLGGEKQIACTIEGLFVCRPDSETSPTLVSLYNTTRTECCARPRSQNNYVVFI